MTEGEAKAKWCPFARVAIGEAAGDGEPIQLVAANRAIDFYNPHHSRCLGSACMAWRWDIEYNRNRKLDKPADAWGFCGLAGKP